MNADAGINYMANLDGAGREAVDRFQDNAENIAVRLEQTANRVRQQANAVSVSRLSAETSLDRGQGPVVFGPAIHNADKLPDVLSASDGILTDIQCLVGNLRLTMLSQAARDAHAGFRRCPPATGDTETEGT